MRAFFFEWNASHIAACSVPKGKSPLTEPLLIERGEDVMIVLPDTADARAYLTSFVMEAYGIPADCEDPDELESVTGIVDTALTP
jgi:hypothetical protein